jgi:osmotically-inducible protein OsmY
MPTTTTAPRFDLQTEILNVLCREPHFLGGNVRAELSDNEVVLKGFVGSYYQKQLAQESLRAVRGIGRVRNELEVADRPARPVFAH